MIQRRTVAYMNSVSLMCQGRKPSVLSTGPNFTTNSGSGMFFDSEKKQKDTQIIRHINGLNRDNSSNIKNVKHLLNKPNNEKTRRGYWLWALFNKHLCKNNNRIQWTFIWAWFGLSHLWIIIAGQHFSGAYNARFKVNFIIPREEIHVVVHIAFSTHKYTDVADTVSLIANIPHQGHLWSSGMFSFKLMFVPLSYQKWCWSRKTTFVLRSPAFPTGRSGINKLSTGQRLTFWITCSTLLESW